MKYLSMHLLLMVAFVSLGAGNACALLSTHTAASDAKSPIGSLNGTTYQQTLESDNTYQIITEAKNGWPFYQTFLKHTWTFDVSPGDATTFYIEAHCDQREDAFNIYYYTDPDNIVLHPLLTITQKEDTLLSAELPEDISGTLYILVEDTDRSWWHGNRDTVYIDHMYIQCAYETIAVEMPAPSSLPVTPLYPENGSTSVYKKPSFLWEGSENAHSFDFHLTRDEDKIRRLDLSPGEELRFLFTEAGDAYVDTLTEPHFTLLTGLEAGFWYYWRISVIDHDGSRTFGPVWKFYVPGLPEIGGDPIPEDIFPVGGGEGYGDILAPGDCRAPDCRFIDYNTLEPPYDDGKFDTPLKKFMVVYDRATLLDALENRAEAGDVVYIADVDDNGEQTVIDMTPVLVYDASGNLDRERSQVKQLIIPRGVTLASGRGRGNSNGAMISQSIPKESDSPHGEFLGDGANDTGYDERYFLDGLRVGGLIIVPGEGLSGSTEPLHFQGEVEGMDEEGIPITRITGLRIKGPRMFYEPSYDQKVLAETGRKLVSGYPITGSRGIFAYNNVIIDNCDISHFSYGAVNIMKTPDVRQKIHHNYIHHTGGSMGYGIEMGDANPFIYANYFNQNRHAIAGVGVNGLNAGNSSYEAAYNIVLDGVTTLDMALHCFDMHGTRDFNVFWLSSKAGNVILIHHNTFSWFKNNGTNNGPNPTNTPVIAIRGVPAYDADSHCAIFSNWFFDPDIDHAVKQAHNQGRMTVFDNRVGMDRREQSQWNSFFW